MYCTYSTTWRSLEVFLFPRSPDAWLRLNPFQTFLLSYDELVVGAPMYTAFGGGTIGIERGRVYVFTNTRVSHGWLVWRVMVWLSDLASSQTAWEENTTGAGMSLHPPSLSSLPLSLWPSPFPPFLSFPPLPLPLPFLPFIPFSFSFHFFTFPPSLSSPIPDIQGDLSQPGMILEGQDDRDRFGNSVTNLGDIDNDGYEGMHVCGMWQWGKEWVSGCVCDGVLTMCHHFSLLPPFPSSFLLPFQTLQ